MRFINSPSLFRKTMGSGGKVDKSKTPSREPDSDTKIRRDIITDVDEFKLWKHCLIQRWLYWLCLYISFGRGSFKARSSDWC